jgi:hypothetical protein
MRRRSATAKPATPPPTAKVSSRDVRLVAVTAFVTVLATTAATGLVGAASGWFDRVRATVSNEQPVRPFVLLERDQQIQGETWVFPQAISMTQPDRKVLAGAYDHIDEFRDWARSHGGVDPSITVLKLVVEGQTKHSVRVIGMRVGIDRRQAPVTGTLLHAGTEQGDDITQVGFDLDENDPVARTVREEGPSVDNYFGAPYFSARQTKTLAQGEQEVFQITARTLKSYVEWHIELKLLLDGQEQTMKVRPADRNIGTTALRRVGSGTPQERTNYAAYKVLYVMDFNQLSKGFVQQDPSTYSPG